MPKVLILYSWDDEISQKRLAAQRSSPYLGGYDFEHSFALKNESDKIEEELIFQRTIDALDSFRPDVLLLHTGAAFHRDPEAFFRIAEKIHDHDHSLRLGIESRGRWGGEVFEDSEEMHQLEDLFFGGY
jgi:hypothetical protein